MTTDATPYGGPFTPPYTGNPPVDPHAGEAPNGKSSGPRGALSAGDTFLSLNGYDELAITEAFGTTVSKLREQDERTTFMRALAFVDMRRKLQGEQAAQARALDAAQLLSIQDVMDYFPDDDDDEDSDQGEGEGR